MAEASKKTYGKELLSWEIGEFGAHSRGAGWYVLAAIVTVALLIWAVLTRNFLFAFIVIMFAVVFATHTLSPPRRYTFSIHELGVRVGERFYPFRDMRQFWIVFEPPEVKMLNFDFGGFRPRLPVPLEDTDPNRVRETLKEYLTENVERTEEPLSDWLARVLKI